MATWIECTPQIITQENYKYTKAYIYKDGKFKRVKAKIYLANPENLFSIANIAIVDKNKAD